jgi:hypothetical protein
MCTKSREMVKSVKKVLKITLIYGMIKPTAAAGDTAVIFIRK